MKTLTLLRCTTCLAVALSACGTDAILLGEILDSAGDDSGSSDDAPIPSDDEPTPEQDPDPQPEDPAPEPPEPISLIEQTVVDILRVNCGNCHIGTGSSGGFDYVDDIDRLIESGLIIPGSREDSPIYARMAEQTMPPASVEQRPTPGQIDLVGFFIDERLE
jgi:hypothetical protein